jgi:CDP-diacylglycerol--glycerol-3-phosphate 3-phosphatidyltransferase
MNLPNLITSIRIGLVPLFVLFFYWPSLMLPILPASVFLAASLTDLLDGYLARRRSEITKLGIIMDPVADKLLVVSALILLVSSGRVPAWMAIVIIGREIAVTALRAVAASEGVIIRAERGGKWKVGFQVAAVFLLILRQDFLGIVLLWGAMVLALLSAYSYFVQFGRLTGFQKTD